MKELAVLLVALAVVGCVEESSPPDARAVDMRVEGTTGDADASGGSDADGAPDLAQPRFNRRSLELSGAGSGYLAVPSAAAITGSSFDQLTISLWIKRRSAATAQSSAIVTFDGPGTFSTQLSLTWSLTTSPPSIALRVPTSAASAPVVDAESWHHLVGVFDGPSAQVRLYLDGQLADTSRAPQAMTMKNALWIGRYQNARADGWLDELAVFAGALDSLAIAAIYNGGAPRDLRIDSGDYNASAQLRAYYRMGDDDEGGLTDQRISDVAGTFDATVVGVVQLSSDVP